MKKTDVIYMFCYQILIFVAGKPAVFMFGTLTFYITYVPRPGIPSVRQGKLDYMA